MSNSDILSREPDLVIAYLSLAQEQKNDKSKFSEIKSICLTKMSSADL